MSKRPIRLSVKAFAALDETGGSLHFGNSILAQGRAEKGQYIHNVIQSQLALDYPDFEAEFAISHTFNLKQVALHLTGRIDGILHQLKMVEEIKSSAFFDRSVKDYSEDPFHPHLMQLKLYGLMLHEKEGHKYDLHMRLVNQYNSDEQKIIPVDWEVNEVKRWILEHEQQLLETHEKEIQNKNRRAELASKLSFPFENFRPQQQGLIRIVGEIFDLKGQAIVQAPTGMGKTGGTIFPALQSSLRQNKTLFYLTPKNSQHVEAQKFVAMLQDQQEQKIVSTTLTAKEKICFKDETICQPEYCEYAKDYFEKLETSQVVQRLREEEHLKKEHFEDYGRTYQVCPFELSLELSLESDIIISDYNYVFAPNAALQRFFDDPEKARTTNVLIDEAHNLYLRAMDYFSPEITFELLTEYESRREKVHKQFQPDFLKFLEEIRLFIRSSEHQHLFGTQQGDTILTQISTEELFKLEKRLTGSIIEYIQVQPLLRPSDPFLQLHGVICDFASILRANNPAIIESFFDNGDDYGLRLTCADASPYLKEIHQKCSGTVAFSATLKPFEFYRDLSGFDKEKLMCYEFPTPFPKENRRIFIDPEVSTAFRDRVVYVQDIAQKILQSFEKKLGNYIVFFPSFAFLQQMLPYLQHRQFQIVAQHAEMSPEDRQGITKEIQDTTRAKIILAVQGGIFSEGVDFPGDQLIGTAIIGPGLPAYTCERKALQKYYDQHYRAGQEYAYIYPAMCKVIQSAGRVIRTEQDKGIILLFDRRFLESKFVRTFPKEWYDKILRELLCDDIPKAVEEFWQG